eukprot:15447228-Alexandrium_andersonii.AAC.1
MFSLADKRRRGKFAAKARPRIFLGLVLQPRHVWTQDYWVISRGDLAQFRSGQVKTIHVHHTAEVFYDHEHPGIISRFTGVAQCCRSRGGPNGRWR